MRQETEDFLHDHDIRRIRNGSLESRGLQSEISAAYLDISRSGLSKILRGVRPQDSRRVREIETALTQMEEFAAAFAPVPVVWDERLENTVAQLFKDYAAHIERTNRLAALDAELELEMAKCNKLWATDVT